MTPFTLRRRLVDLIQRSLPEQEHEAFEVMGREMENEEVEEVYAVPVGAIPIGTQGVPHSLARFRTGSVMHGNPWVQQTSVAMPAASQTLRNGPTGNTWAMKVVDCGEHVDPAHDEEVQRLLANGWEPFGVHTFNSHTGARGVRVYFKRSSSPQDHA